MNIKNYDWDLKGDGDFDAHGSTVTWSYPAPGPACSAAFKGNGNHRGEAVHTVPSRPRAAAVVAPPTPPVASFTISSAAPVANQPVQFTSTSRDPDGTIMEQVWDLNGDGNYDNGGGPTALRDVRRSGPTWSGSA